MGALPALVLSLLAGLATAVGGALALFAKRDDSRFLCAALGFSAGVMVAVSFSELLPESQKYLSASGRGGPLLSLGCFALGMAGTAAIDAFVPAPERASGAARASGRHEQALLRVGAVTAIAITVHNFPEGVTTFMAGYADLRIGLPVALSIALHNIPEGMAVAVPVYYGSGSRARGFWMSALSGLSEPFGALLAYLFLAPWLGRGLLGAVFGVVAGVMVYIAFAELLPASEQYGGGRRAAAGVLSGALVMLAAVSLFGG